MTSKFFFLLSFCGGTLFHGLCVTMMTSNQLNSILHEMTLIQTEKHIGSSFLQPPRDIRFTEPQLTE